VGDVLVDSGAIYSVLPTFVWEQLGLIAARDVDFSLADIADPHSLTVAQAQNIRELLFERCEEPFAAAVLELLNAVLKIAGELREQFGIINPTIGPNRRPVRADCRSAIEQEQTHVALRLAGQSQSQKHDVSEPLLTHWSFRDLTSGEKRIFSGCPHIVPA
jgi:hypothetical protein